MALGQYAINPLQAFQTGASLRGPSALGQMAMVLTQSLMKMQEAKSAARFETNEKIRAAGPIKEAEMAAETGAFEKQIKAIGGMTGGQGGPTITEAKVGPFTMSFPGAAQEKARQKGLEDDAVRISRLRGAVPLLQQIERKVGGLPVIRGAGERAQKAPGILGAHLLQSNPAVTEYVRFIDANRPTLARFAGDVGNLALPEQAAAARGVPGIFDRQEVKAKLLGGYYEKIILGASRTSREQGGGLTEEDVAKELGGTWDPRTKNFSSPTLELIRAGQPVEYPQQPEATLKRSKVSGRYYYEYPDGSTQELGRGR